MSTSAAPDDRPGRPDTGATRRSRGLLRGSAVPNGAAIGVAVVVLTLWFWRSAEQLIAGAAWTSWRILLVDLALAGGVGLAAGLVVAVVAGLLRRRIGLWLPWSIVTAGFLAATMGGGASLTGWLMLVTVVLLGAGLVGGSVVGARLGRRSARTTGGVGALLVLLVAAFLVWPGPGAQPAPVPPATGPAMSADATDPGVGTVSVTELRYGSTQPGTEPAYRTGLALTAAPVDGSALVQGWGPGTTRTDVWGFDSSQLPVQGLLFVPAGSGPAPLVVIVHGNSLFAGSENGFGYLARALARRGYVVAAIDENFLSTGLLDRSDPIGGAGITRAWLVLQHVHRLLQWSGTAGNDLSGRIDPRQVALVGHSRGGEAVAVAAVMARGDGSVPGTPSPRTSTSGPWSRWHRATARPCSTRSRSSSRTSTTSRWAAPWMPTSAPSPAPSSTPGWSRGRAG